MDLQTCSKCGNEFQKGYKYCPFCKDNEKNIKKRKILKTTIVIAFIAVIGYLAWMKFFTQNTHYSNEEIYQVTEKLVLSMYDVPEIKMAPIEKHIFSHVENEKTVYEKMSGQVMDLKNYFDCKEGGIIKVSSYIDYRNNLNAPMRNRFTCTITNKGNGKFAISDFREY